jgi:hypothetical protein
METGEEGKKEMMKNRRRFKSKIGKRIEDGVWKKYGEL